MPMLSISPAEMTGREPKRLLDDDLLKRFRCVLSVFEHLNRSSGGVFAAAFVKFWDIARAAIADWELSGQALLGDINAPIHGLRIATFLVQYCASTGVVGEKL